MCDAIDAASARALEIGSRSQSTHRRASTHRRRRWTTHLVRRASRGDENTTMDATSARAATTATKNGVETHYLEGLNLMTTHAFILIPSPPSLGNTYGLFPLLVFRVTKN